MQVLTASIFCDLVSEQTNCSVPISEARMVLKYYNLRDWYAVVDDSFLVPLIFEVDNSDAVKMVSSPFLVVQEALISCLLIKDLPKTTPLSAQVESFKKKLYSEGELIQLKALKKELMPFYRWQFVTKGDSIRDGSVFVTSCQLVQWMTEKQFDWQPEFLELLLEDCGRFFEFRSVKQSIKIAALPLYRALSI